MKKVTVNYINDADQVLMTEQAYYFDLPPVGRCIYWGGNYYKVIDIEEDWDNKTIKITLDTL